MKNQKKIEEEIRNILNEEMYNYGNTNDIGKKDEIFDRACNQVFKLFKQEIRKK